MGALTDELRRFLDGQPVGVLATPSAEARPRQSLVYFARDGERLLISTLTNRLKAQDVRRSGWASLCVMEHEPPEPMSDEALREVGRVILAITVQRVSAANYIEPATTAGK